jgi:hypothetical protein
MNLVIWVLSFVVAVLMQTRDIIYLRYDAIPLYFLVTILSFFCLFGTLVSITINGMHKCFPHKTQQMHVQQGKQMGGLEQKCPTVI